MPTEVLVTSLHDVVSLPYIINAIDKQVKTKQH